MEPVDDSTAATGPAATTPSDGVLVNRVLAGERDAFDSLVRRYQRQAVAVSYGLLGNAHDAQEVSQDAFLKAFRSLTTLQKPEAFGGWLLRIVSNLSLNFRRGRRLRQQMPLDDLFGNAEQNDPQAGGDSTDPLRTLQGKELGRKLQEALEALPEKQRLAILMFTIEQMPQKQVADILECSVEAVKWHVFQGRKKLKETLKNVI